MHEHILIIFGPTGVGKSDFAEIIAQHFPAEIINMDVGQFYVPLTIGTAKPAWQKSPIVHRLFDIISEPRNITVVEYRDLVISAIKSAQRSGKLPILVGGSGFYLMSLFYPPRANTLLTEQEEQGTWQELYELDPERAQSIHPHDNYRIKRALTIIKSTGKKSSSYKPLFDPIAPFILVELTRDRSELYKKINERTEHMLAAGWVEEVKRLQGTPWEPFLQQKKLIGYDDILKATPSLDGDPIQKEYQKLVKAIQQKTRHYAKRQLTFGRMLFTQLSRETAYLQKTHSSIHQFNLTLSPVSLYIKQLLELFNEVKDAR